MRYGAICCRVTQDCARYGARCWHGALGCAFPGRARCRRFEHRTVLGVTGRLSCVTVPFAVVSRRIARVTGPVAGTGPPERARRRRFEYRCDGDPFVRHGAICCRFTQDFVRYGACCWYGALGCAFPRCARRRCVAQVCLCHGGFCSLFQGVDVTRRFECVTGLFAAVSRGVT